MVTNCHACQLTFYSRPEAPRCPRCGTPASFPPAQPFGMPPQGRPPQGAAIARTQAMDPARFANPPPGYAPPASLPLPPLPPNAPVPEDPATRLTLSIVLSVLAFLGACVNPIAPVAIVFGVVAYSAAQGTDSALAARRTRTAFRLALVAVCGTVAIWAGLAIAFATGTIGN